MLLFGAGLHGEAEHGSVSLGYGFITKGHAPVPLQQAEGSGHAVIRRRKMRYDSWPMRIVRLAAPLALYLLIGLLSMAGSGSYSLAVSLLEKAVCACAMGGLFLRDSRTIVWERQEFSASAWIAAALLGVFAAIGLNELFAASGLTKLLSADYSTVTQALYHQDLLLEALVLVIAAPLAEELLFRGVLFRRMRTYCSWLPAALITSLIFAAFHGNILQGVYGFLLGMLLTWVYERLHTIWGAVLLHAAANAASLLATEWSGLSALISWSPWLSAVVGLAAAAGFGLWLKAAAPEQDTYTE